MTLDTEQRGFQQTVTTEQSGYSPSRSATSS